MVSIKSSAYHSSQEENYKNIVKDEIHIMSRDTYTYND